MRLALAATLGNRDETTAKDERILNGLVESHGGRRKGDRATVIKRPGLLYGFQLLTGTGGATQGQGLFVYNTPSAPGVLGSIVLIGIRGDVLTRPVEEVRMESWLPGYLDPVLIFNPSHMFDSVFQPVTTP